MNNTLPTFFEVQKTKQQNEIDRLKGLPFTSLGNTITDTHFLKVVKAMQPSQFQQERLVALCVEYNALTHEQQVAQNEAHLSAEDDFAVFTDEHGIAIIQHDPTYTTFKALGYDGVEMITRTML